MKRTPACLPIAMLVCSTQAFADRYGIDEALADGSSDTNLSDMVWGGVLLVVIYLVWKKFFG